MQTIGVQDLKDRLAEVLRSLKAGERISVTDGGVVVGELGPPGNQDADASEPVGLAQLAQRGLARLGRPNDPALYRALPPLEKKPRSVMKLLDETRRNEKISSERSPDIGRS